MKKMLFVTFSGLLCLLFSCKSKDSGGGMSAQAQKNLDAIHGITKAIETGDLSKLGDYIAADAVDHSGEHGDVKSLDSIKAQLATWTNMASDMKTEIIKEIADDEYVMSFSTQSGTMKAAAMGMPAGPYKMTTVEVSKFKDGKATEHWTFMDGAEMMKMMGGAQSPMEMKSDTTKKMDSKM